MEMSDEMLDSCILLVSNAGKALLGPGPDEELSTEMKILAKLADGQVRHNKATCIMLLHKAATLECLGLCTDVSAKSLHVCRKSGQRGVCFRSLGQQVGVLMPDIQYLEAGASHTEMCAEEVWSHRRRCSAASWGLQLRC